MRNLIILLTVAIVGIALSGCVPMYQSPAISQSVGMNISELDDPQICINHQWQNLFQNNGDGYTRIPFGKRIVVSNNHMAENDEGSVTEVATCRPVVSFIPKKGQQYYLNFLIKGRYCILNVLHTQSGAKNFVIDNSERPGKCI